MNNYVILSDSACDLDSNFRTKYDVDYVPMSFVVDGKIYDANLDWKPFSAKEFYDLMRDGKRITTAQVNVETYKKAFKAYAEAGKDVLYIACSSNISASINSARTAREEILKDYPNAKIIIVDALRACYALGIIVLTASENRAKGMSIEDNAKWIEENKLTARMEGTVDTLKYLKQAGRVSAAAAFFGGLLTVKPIIVADALGRNFSVAKVKGRKNSIEYLAQSIKENIEDVPHQKVFISHADCIEDAEILKQAIFEKLGKEIDVHIGYVGPCVGASVGPGMISTYYFGKKVTLNEGE